MTLKIGIIGTNFISDDFCDAAAQVDGIELYAVYSRSAYLFFSYFFVVFECL